MKKNNQKHKENIGCIAESIVQKLATIPSIRATFKKNATAEDKKIVRQLTHKIQTGFLEALTSNDDHEKLKKADDLYNNMIKRAEIWTKVLTTEKGTKVESYLMNVFTQVQQNDELKDPNYSKTLEEMNAPTLAKASKLADKKVIHKP